MNLYYLETKRTKCTGKAKFLEFKNLSMSIHDAEFNEELKNEGCMIPNCKQRKWIITSESTQFRDNTHKRRFSTLIYTFSPKAKVMVRKEFNQYTIVNFFADLCGYTSLFLGESLLSYVLQLVHWIRKAIKKLKNHPTEQRKKKLNEPKINHVRNMFLRQHEKNVTKEEPCTNLA